MPTITRSVAYANNEVAWVAWDSDGMIPGCVGFHIVREYLDQAGDVVEERPLASWVAFRGPNWQPQNTTVWPIQKFSWRDLTLRKKRDLTGRNPAEAQIRYRIRCVGKMRAGLEPVVPIPERHWDEATKQRVDNAYVGRPVLWATSVSRR